MDNPDIAKMVLMIIKSDRKNINKTLKTCKRKEFVEKSKDPELYIKFFDFLLKYYVPDSSYNKENFLVRCNSFTEYKNNGYKSFEPKVEEYKEFLLNKGTRILFKKKENLVAVGYLDNDDEYSKLDFMHIHICDSNKWFWDINSIDQTWKDIVSPWSVKL
jgi:hypothetical protein